MVTPLNIPKEYAAEIGYVCIQFGTIEHMLDEVIWNFLKLDTDSGLYVTPGMQLQAKLSLLSNLTKRKIKTPALRKDINDCVKAIKDQKEHRNLFSHGGYDDFAETQKYNGVSVYSHQKRGTRHASWRGKVYYLIHIKTINAELSKIRKNLLPYAKIPDYWQMTSQERHASIIHFQNRLEHAQESKPNNDQEPPLPPQSSEE